MRSPSGNSWSPSCSAEPKESALNHPLDRHFRTNIFGICSVELLWGFGMPLVIESTFLQLFLRRLGASSFLIGLIPTLISAGIALSSPFSFSLTGHLERKRTAVILVHVFTALPVLAFGLILGFTGLRSSTLAVFLIAYALFSIGVGLLNPAWNNYLVKIFPEQRAIPAMAATMTAQSAAKLVGSLYLVRLVERYSFSARGSSLVFGLVGLLFLIGSFPFLFTVEQADRQASSASASSPRSLRSVLGNRRFLLFLGTELEYIALSGVIYFYANYATEYRGVSPALAAGLFVACNYLGGVLANVLLGWVNLCSLRNKYLLTKALALFGILLLVLLSAPWVFYLSSLLFGASRGTRMMLWAPAIKRLTGAVDVTLYFAISPILVLPLSIGLPLANGAFLDSFAYLGAWSYRIVFLAMALFSLGGIAFTLRVPWSVEPARERV
jgi:predicted MFS family arabinose efflux permease